MRQRALISIPFLVAAAALVWGLSQRQAAGLVRHALEASYQQDFYDLLDQSEQLQAILGKTLAANTAGEQTALLTEVWFRASMAQEAISRLPIREPDLSATRKFLMQMADYARSLARRTAEGRTLDDREAARLSRFEDEAARLGGRLHALRPRLTPPRFQWTSLLAGARPPRTPGRQTVAGRDLQAFGDVNERLRRLPALIYDGPYSDHLEEVKPRGLSGPAIDAGQAARLALRFNDPAGTAGYRVEGRPRPVFGRLPAFHVVLREPRGKGRIVTDVSRQGGQVVWMLNSRPLGEPRLGEDETLRRAADFLRGHGYPDMVPTHSVRERGAEVIAFAARLGRVLVYPDQVKVKVALDDGQVIGFDAVQYLTNHHERRLPQPRLTPAQALARVRGRLEPDSVRLVVIPTGGGKEALAYEVRGRLKGSTYLIYVNALTGEEENILKAVPTPGGRLLM